jgi:hypothetical protein
MSAKYNYRLKSNSDRRSEVFIKNEGRTSCIGVKLRERRLYKN